MNQNQNNQYQEFNKFQIDFYTSIENFRKYTFYDIRRFGVLLLNNITKAFPFRARQIFDMYSPDVKGVNSPEIFYALQRMFVNNFSVSRVPQFIYFRGKMGTKQPKPKVRKNKNNFIDFDTEIESEIKSRLFLDSKTYLQLKYSKEIQKLGNILIQK